MSMTIKSCFDLVSISPHQDITSLQSFIIDTCEKLSDLLIAWLTLPLLETFLVINCLNLRSFPSLQGAGSHLQSLGISSGDEVLLTRLQSCTSLSSLSIDQCPNLKSIPYLRELYYPSIHFQLPNVKVGMFARAISVLHQLKVFEDQWVL